MAATWIEGNAVVRSDMGVQRRPAVLWPADGRIVVQDSPRSVRVLRIEFGGIVIEVGGQNVSHLPPETVSRVCINLG